MRQSKQPSPTSEAARETRARFIAALARGLSTEEATRLANKAPNPVKPLAVDPQTSPPEPLDALRAQYTALVGKKPYMGWDANTLRERMAAAKGATND